MLLPVDHIAHYPKRDIPTTEASQWGLLDCGTNKSVAQTSISGHLRHSTHNVQNINATGAHHHEDRIRQNIDNRSGSRL
jgi:hypothetical protein